MRVAVLIGACVASGLGLCLAAWVERRSDSAIVRSLPQPTIRTSTVSPFVILGRARLATAVLLFAGALLTGGIGVRLAGSPEEVTMAEAFVVCVLVLAVVVAGLVVELLRRSRVAVDDPSSLLDDQIRWADARSLLTPVTIVTPASVLAFVVTIGSTPDTGFYLIFLLYAFGAPAISATVERIARGASPVALAWESTREARTSADGFAPG
jgi:hypothetical protein